VNGHGGVQRWEQILAVPRGRLDHAQRYGWINRALPDAELSTFVDRFARRIASFEQPAIAAAKAQINKRAGVPSGEDLVEARTVFLESSTWPGTQRRVREALAQGLQQLAPRPPAARRLRTQPRRPARPAD